MHNAGFNENLIRLSAVVEMVFVIESSDFATLIGITPEAAPF